MTRVNGKALGHRAPGRPFQRGTDARRGRGPKRGARNAGRPRTATCTLLSAAFHERIPLLKQIADGEIDEATVGDRLRALDMMAKYGQFVPIAEVHERLRHMLVALEAKLGPGSSDDLLRQVIRPAWQ